MAAIALIKFGMRLLALLLLFVGLFVCNILHAQPPAKPVIILNEQRYKQNPVYLLFESYILDVIGQLPPERAKSIQEMNLQRVLKTKSSEWHESLKEALGLSPTIDIAILDLWYRNQEIAHANRIEYSAQQFAIDFTDQYMKEGSQVDVWPPGALESARKRIQIQQSKEGNR